ncbi:gliding motility-associated ABC transporter substrate-binding protein GldG [Chitinophaga nivalis]|uniref:Gliding motility-associated ABC transporter substrate-binding protein GldG n=1 Tax=Chitinophaga nivalis TaxID=2991709 RepID=A0ABT3ITY6_9BACT|nr:gliding motility-associated ABC transporter substrate-binding protein GldG [Chitinophaga nivalis]MCW3462867.1 gliding motility-associated ABC transporter substrate-binding protein GldG [Chitinophaga nivalis]MCW3487443.1 gliding motility-associated ABC transporter substrate-binding protein GldG [Chitinophaga nivalis]
MAKRKKYIQRAVTVILLLTGLNIAAAYFHGRWDLTAEKRYTLTSHTRQLLRQLNSPVEIEVFLKGDYPASFRQLATATNELLEEFREYGKQNIKFVFVNPGQGLPDSSRMKVLGELTAQGIMPFNMKVQEDAGDGFATKLIFPGALVHYKGKTIGVNLLKNQGGQDPMQTMNNSEALLEYQFANAISKLQEEKKPLIGYMMGHGESLGAEVYDALNTLQSSYELDTLTLQGTDYIPRDFNIILFAKPAAAFSDADKLKIDQYVMNGGKVLWFIDESSASMDSLQRHPEFYAFDRGLNLEDLLFRYGVRINQDLLQDLQCDVVPLVVGNVGNRPQIQPVPFPYFPMLTPTGHHAIVKNLDLVLSRFVSSLDTIKNESIRKTILLTTSVNSRTVRIPAQVSWDMVRTRPNPREFRQQHVPAAVLLEGHFTSLFRNRQDPVLVSRLEQASKQAFKATSDSSNQMIVVSDGDLIANAVSRKDGPLQMGINEYNPGFAFANKEFFLNCLEYLSGNNGVMEARNKELTLRLLDAEKVKREKTKWQVICFLVPVGLVLLFAMIFQFIRQRKFVA